MGTRLKPRIALVGLVAFILLCVLIFHSGLKAIIAGVTQMRAFAYASEPFELMNSLGCLHHQEILGGYETQHFSRGGVETQHYCKEDLKSKNTAKRLTGVTSYKLQEEIVNTLKDTDNDDVLYGGQHFFKQDLTAKMALPVPGDGNFFIQEVNMTAKDYDQLERSFYGHLLHQQYDCRNMMRAGIAADGGWEVCMDPPFEIKSGSCLIYSLGLGGEWSFDRFMSKTCKVYGFDPSIGLDQDSKEMGPNMWFYNTGLFRENKLVKWTNGQQWNLRTLGTIRKMLNHTDAIIDYLKMDVEESEWGALATAIKEGALKNVKQLGVEFHIWNFSKYIRRKHIFVLKKIEELGFKVYFFEKNGSSRFKSKYTGRVLTWANNIYFVNTNFIHA